MNNIKLIPLLSLCSLAFHSAHASDAADSLFVLDHKPAEIELGQDFSDRFNQTYYASDTSRVAIRFDQDDIEHDMLRENADFCDAQPSTWTFGYALSNKKDFQFAFEFLRINSENIDLLEPDDMVRDVEFVQQFSFRVAY